MQPARKRNVPERAQFTTEEMLRLRREARGEPFSVMDIRGETDQARHAARELRHRAEWAPLRDMEGGDDD